MGNRREFLRDAARACGAAAFAGSALGACATLPGGKDRPPNVVLIMSDDQGFGDLGCGGNTKIKTPNIDRLFGESVRFTQFHVSPVCSPTRSSLMTGRYNYRTGVVDTYQGRSMMWPNEVTIAEMLLARGYRTGIFGKWHLGDNYPMRAMDQGFQESLVHKGGGICQPSEPRNNSYFDPVLEHNGIEEKRAGYCADIFTRAAIEFVRKNANAPFFAYLATNTPHAPLIVDDKYAAPYLAMGLDEKVAKVYGMIANLDENVGLLMAALKALGIEDNTIVIFMTDNGPYFAEKNPRYNAGMRDGKGTVYEGGLRVPFFMRWPGRLEPGREIDRIAAHIDVAPTLLEACGLASPRGVKFDGRSLWPLATGANTDWPDRTLFFQWHRGDKPEPFRNSAVRTQRFKLVNGAELYDIPNDPGEQKNVAAENPDTVARLRAEYDVWFGDVCGSRGFDPPRIYIGTEHENPTVLTRQDWRGSDSWHDGNNGYWEVNVTRAARYDISVEFPETAAAGTVHFKFNDLAIGHPIDKGATQHVFSSVRMPRQIGRLSAWTTAGESGSGAALVTVKREAR